MVVCSSTSEENNQIVRGSTVKRVHLRWIPFWGHSGFSSSWLIREPWHRGTAAQPCPEKVSSLRGPVCSSEAQAELRYHQVLSCLTCLRVFYPRHLANKCFWRELTRDWWGSHKPWRQCRTQIHMRTEWGWNYLICQILVSWNHLGQLHCTQGINTVQRDSTDAF